MTEQDIVERLELKLAYLEKAQHDMSDILILQQRELDSLKVRLSRLTDRLNEAEGDTSKFDPDKERPPHY
jgi:uncharacterized coiled-coil protein SlyX